MEYKFFVVPGARICSGHLNVVNYWPLVKQISKEVSDEEQKHISNMMFDYYQEKDSKKAVFDMDGIENIKDEVFKDWFGYYQNQFKKICEFAKNCKPRDVAIF